MNNRITSIRREAGLSQEAFAKRLNVTENYVWMIENGKRIPSKRLIQSIIHEFNVNEEWLRTGEGEMFAETAEDWLHTLVRKKGLSEEDYTLLAGFVNLPPANRRAVIDYMRSVVARLDEILPATAPPASPPPKPPQEMTPEEIRAEVDRQLDEEERGGSTASGSKRSGTA